MVTVAITIDTRAVVERMEMLRRGCSLLLLLLLLLLMQLPTVVSVTAIPAHLNLVRVVVQIGTLLLLLVMMMTTVGHQCTRSSPAAATTALRGLCGPSFGYSGSFMGTAGANR